MESFGQMPNLRILSIGRLLYDQIVFACTPMKTCCSFRFVSFFLLKKNETPHVDTCACIRNQIKKIAKLEDVAKTLEELWISYNQIKTLDELMPCENLEVSYRIKLTHSIFLSRHFQLLTI